MHHSLSHRAASRSSHPNPKLYAGLTGDITWQVWQTQRDRSPLLRPIEDLAIKLAGKIPNRSEPEYQARLDRLLESTAMNRFLWLFRHLPDDVRPGTPMTGPRAVSFCLNLSARILRSSRP